MRFTFWSFFFNKFSYFKYYGRIPDRLPDGRPAVAWERRWTEGTLPLWLVATAGGIAVIFVLGIFFYGSYQGVGAGG